MESHRDAYMHARICRSVLVDEMAGETAVSSCRDAKDAQKNHRPIRARVRTGDEAVAAALALAAADFAVRPALAFVGLDHIGEGRQLGLLWAVPCAAHQCVGSIHEQG